MEPNDPTTPIDVDDDRPAIDLSRRRLLLGAAAGAASVPPPPHDVDADRPAIDLSRRRLLLGAAAGALSVPLLRSGAAAATSALSGDGGLIREPAGGLVSGVWDWRFK